ncbi:hypothetical protein DPMN_101189 [Dreissena polymorpha]|uniref:Uncharacterized protein n=1 Tax=Dreissena polymorpha TaxID=45954 RepID=A0A9D4LIG1_DREPO|nr:hypothetical protein DPMN_101189 [Dreissena polymorpha]
MLNRLKTVEETYEYDDCQDYPGQSCDYDYDDTDEVAEECESVKSGPCPSKMKSDSRFASMEKRFKGKEITDEAVDSALVENINDVLKNGMDEEQYTQMVKDENIARPENCEALVTVKYNKMIRHVSKTSTKFIDK